MPRYKYFDTSQGLFLTACLEQQLIPGSFDTAFHNDTTGYPAYPPAVTLKIIFYCYSRGIITGRPIEYACKTNIIVKALARDAESGYDTIARFISGQAEAVKYLFSRRRPRVTRRGSSGENCSP
jgi:transposase